MKACVPKNKTMASKPVGFPMPLSLQEDLTAAIHGAFEVAVEIAVLEVTKLVSVAAEDMYERIRQENETLKQELLKAQSAIGGGDSCQNNQVVHDNITSTARNVSTCDQDLRETPPADPHEEQGAGDYFKSQSDAVLDLQEQLNAYANDTLKDKEVKLCHRESKGREINKETSPECAVKLESTNHSCIREETQDCSLPSVSFIDASQLVKVKEENPEEIINASNCLVDSVKEEAITQLQSEMIEDWMPGLSDFQNEENASLLCTSQAQAHSPNINSSLEPALDSSSLIDFTVTAQMTNQVPTREPSTQIYGGPVRRNQGHTSSNLHSCKLCGQTFPLPSLLRRHYGQCQQKHNQRHFVPVAGGKRPKLQLYPPGCSPFRCTECNREFNRLENLKTHLRIHTGERPYKCSVCSTSFRHSGALTRHFRIHTGEKPYVCGHCGKSFRNCGGLKFHQRSHNK